MTVRDGDAHMFNARPKMMSARGWSELGPSSRAVARAAGSAQLKPVELELALRQARGGRRAFRDLSVRHPSLSGSARFKRRKGWNSDAAMGSVLPLVGIAALMVFGMVVLLTALAYEPPPQSDRPPDRALARERGPQRKLRRQAQRALSARRSATQESVVPVRTRAIALADEWWPRLRRHARAARVRGLTLESTTGQLIAAAAASVVAAHLIVTLG